MTLIEPSAEWDCGIFISDIRKNGEPHIKNFELALGGAVAYWGQNYTPLSPLRALITAGVASGDIMVRVELDCEFSVPCYRCLEETGIAIKGDMRYIFSLRQPEADGENTSGSDKEHTGEPDGVVDAIRIEPFKAELDMAPYVWETMILNLPERVLCAEECRGLCPACGSNRNEMECDCSEDRSDPRLELLKKFL